MSQTIRGAVESLNAAFEDVNSRASVCSTRDEDIHIIVYDKDIGQFFKVAREEGLETETWRSLSKNDHIRGWASFEE